MKKGNSIPNAALLRQKAEALLKKKPAKTGSQRSEFAINKLNQELEVHQIELELQNEELKLAQSAAMETAEKYTELYDFAPMGYLTLSNSGIIIELNLLAAEMIGKERSLSINRPFGLYISEKSKPVFSLFRRNVFISKSKQTCELNLLQDAGVELAVLLTGIATGNGEQCRITMVDITERRQIEDKLLSEQTFRKSIEVSLSSGIAVADQAGRQIYVNPSFCRLLGWSEEELTGRMSPYVYWPPEHLRAIGNAFQVTLEGKAPHEGFELVFSRKDGTHVPVQVVISPFSDGKKLIGWLANVIDITERKQNEEKLKSSETRFRSIINVFPVSMALNDKHQNITFLNPAFVQTFGYTLEDIPTISHWWPKAYPDPEYRKWVAGTWVENIQTAKRTETPFTPMEVTVRCNDGSDKIMLVSATLFPTPFDDLNLVVFYDITDRKQAEENLRKSEELFRQFMFNSPGLVYLKDDKLRLLKISKSLAELLGKPESELIGRDSYEHVPPEFAKSAIADDMKVISEGAVIENEEVMKGRVFTTIKFPIRTEIGKITHIAGFSMDITDRKQAENEIHDLNETLEQRISERTAQLEASNKDLRFHLSEVEQFTFIASHDLQEPLRTITNFTQLLRESYAGKLDEDGSKFIEFISGSAERMRALVTALLEYTLLGKGSEMSLVDCNESVREALADLADSIAECQANISFQALPRLNGYHTEMRLLFQNLLKNAIKFQEKGNLPEIKISAQNRPGEWLFSVADNGIGIREKDREKVFTIFKRMHNRSDFEGTGIGLAHCKKIVELHGGRIWVESTPGEGSTFLFTIPRR